MNAISGEDQVGNHISAHEGTQPRNFLEQKGLGGGLGVVVAEKGKKNYQLIGSGNEGTKKVSTYNSILQGLDRRNLWSYGIDDYMKTVALKFFENARKGSGRGWERLVW